MARFWSLSCSSFFNPRSPSDQDPLMRTFWFLSLLGLLLAGPALAQGNADQGKVTLIVM